MNQSITPVEKTSTNQPILEDVKSLINLASKIQKLLDVIKNQQELASTNKETFPEEWEKELFLEIIKDKLEGIKNQQELVSTNKGTFTEEYQKFLISEEDLVPEEDQTLLEELEKERNALEIIKNQQALVSTNKGALTEEEQKLFEIIKNRQALVSTSKRTFTEEEERSKKDMENLKKSLIAQIENIESFKNYLKDYQIGTLDFQQLKDNRFEFSKLKTILGIIESDINYSNKLSEVNRNQTVDGLSSKFSIFADKMLYPIVIAIIINVIVGLISAVIQFKSYEQQKVLEVDQKLVVGFVDELSNIYNRANNLKQETDSVKKGDSNDWNLAQPLISKESSNLLNDFNVLLTKIPYPKKSDENVSATGQWEVYGCQIR